MHPAVVKWVKWTGEVSDGGMENLISQVRETAELTGVRTHAPWRTVDLKSNALDHSAMNALGNNRFYSENSTLNTLSQMFC